MPKLTTKFVESVEHFPTRGQVFYRDNQLRGFALRVTRESKSYVVESRVNGVNRRITIGPHGPYTLKAARREAQKLLVEMKSGRDPRLEKLNSKIESATLGEVFQTYLEIRTLRPNSVRHFSLVVRRCLSEWLDIPITKISKEMVIAKHQALTKPTKQGSSGQAQANLAMEIVGILLNFAANRYEINGQPVLKDNPIKALSQIKAWHKIPRRQTLIPDHKLADWYKAVASLKNEILRDYFLLLLLTGLRRNEAATLRWTEIDFDCRTLTVLSVNTKNKREHRLPLSDFLLALLLRRKQARPDSMFVFPGNTGDKPIRDPSYAVSSIGRRCNHKFKIHDLRRNFLTAADLLEIPHYALKKLANHVSDSDVTAGYIVVDVERLRIYMQKISAHFIDLMGASLDNFSAQERKNS